MRDLQSQNKDRVEDGVTLTGAVSIGKNTVIKSGAFIEGPVIIGNNCTIGPNCYIRPYTSIGDNCKIGQSVEIKGSVIMPNCNIQHLSYVGDSVVGEGSNLGAGTITANHRHDDASIKSKIKDVLVDTKRNKMGAILSDGVQTGIHTSIYPGRKLWPNIQTRPGAIVDDDIVPDDFEW